MVNIPSIKHHIKMLNSLKSRKALTPEQQAFKEKIENYLNAQRNALSDMLTTFGGLSKQNAQEWNELIEQIDRLV